MSKPTIDTSQYPTLQSYKGNGSVRVFNFDIQAVLPNDIAIEILDEASQVSKKLIYVTDYTVALNQQSNGGLLTLKSHISTPTSSHKVTIWLDKTIAQPAIFQNNIDINVVNSGFQTSGACDASIEEKLNRAVKISPSDYTDFNSTISQPIDRTSSHSLVLTATKEPNTNKFFLGFSITDDKAKVYSPDVSMLLNAVNIDDFAVNRFAKRLTDNARQDFFKALIDSIDVSILTNWQALVDFSVGTQSDWNQTNNTKPDFIKNKPNVTFTQSLVQNGYTILPNGLIFQWGNQHGTVTFPIAFPNACIAVFGQNYANNSTNSAVNNVIPNPTTTGFTIHLGFAAGRWFAIGY